MSSFNTFSGSFTRCCKDCTRRYVGCHSECKQYMEAKNEHEKRKQWEKEHEAPYLRAIDFNKLGYGAKTKTKPKLRKK